MAKSPNLTPAQLRQLLRYEPETGKLFWRARGPEWFTAKPCRSAEGQARIFNGQFAGREAGCLNKCLGYIYVHVSSMGHVPAHRVILAMENGEWPEIVDHINGDKADNRLGNLRSVTQSENLRNAVKWGHNTSGVTGVSLNARDGVWRAYIKVDQKMIWLGQSKDFADAVRLRQEAEKRYGFTERHGT